MMVWTFLVHVPLTLIVALDVPSVSVIVPLCVPIDVGWK